MSNAAGLGINLIACCVLVACIDALTSAPPAEGPATPPPSSTSGLEFGTAPPVSSATPNTAASAAGAFETTPSHGPMIGVTPTKFGERLKALGLDVRQLPKLEQVDRARIHELMGLIGESTGATCIDCHGSKTDFAKPTPRKRVTTRMWNDWIRAWTTAKGEPVFCDSCHHGALTFIEHNTGIVAWMDANYVKGLARKDQKARHCPDCHGSPFNPAFVEDWKAATDSP
jgi:hypothetical protein